MSDKIYGPVLMMKRMALVSMLLSLPVAFLLSSPLSVTSFIILQLLLGFMVGTYVGPTVAVAPLLFPVNVLSVGSGLAYAVGMVLFSGIGPLLYAQGVLAGGGFMFSLIVFGGTGLMSYMALTKAQNSSNPL